MGRTTERVIQDILKIDPDYEISICQFFYRGLTDPHYEVEIYRWDVRSGNIDSTSIVNSIKPTATEALSDVLRKLEEGKKLS